MSPDYVNREISIIGAIETLRSVSCGKAHLVEDVDIVVQGVATSRDASIVRDKDRVIERAEVGAPDTVRHRDRTTKRERKCRRRRAVRRQP